MKPIETTFKRIETKYVVSKEILDKLVQDLKKYLVEATIQFQQYQISTLIQKTLIFSKKSILATNEKKRYGCGPISANLK